METKAEKLLRKDYEFFKSQLPSLLKSKNKRNKFAVIRDEQIIGIYESFEEALNTAEREKHFELGTFLIQKIEKQQVHHIYKRVCAS